MRYDFASDTTAAICPQAWAALAEANHGAAASYGDDSWTKTARRLVSDLFETKCEVFFLLNGTAANALALAHLGRSFHSIICHEHAHINTDECAAPEFFSAGAKLLPVTGGDGKVDLAAADEVRARQRPLHSPKPGLISVTQSTELGTVYRRDELMLVREYARKHSLQMHMDGARLANALATLDCPAKAITSDVGVDVLCFGGSKNGIALGELVIFFDGEQAREFDYRSKQAGQLASKMRFIAAAWAGLLRDGVWLANARHANQHAALLEKKLSTLGWPAVFTREANALFVRMSQPVADSLQARGWQFYKFIEPDIYRLMCSWATTEKAIDDFVADLASLLPNKE